MLELKRIQKQIDSLETPQPLDDRQSEIQALLLSQRVLDEFADEEQTKVAHRVSIKDLIELEQQSLESRIFCLETAPTEQSAGFKKYFTFRAKTFGGDDPFTVLKATDVSVSTRLQHLKVQKKALHSVSVFIWHEMRMPINNMFAMNLKLAAELTEQSSLLASMLDLASR